VAPFERAAGASSLDKSTLECQTGPRGVEVAGGTIWAARGGVGD